MLVLDGVYPGPSHDLGSFVPLQPPETEGVARVLAGTARRIVRIAERRGLDTGEDLLASDEPMLTLLTAASIPSRIATGPEAGERWRRLGDRVEPLDREEGGKGNQFFSVASPRLADLLQRVFEVDAPARPKCGGRMRVLSAITIPIVAARILRRLALPARAPPLAAAREKVGPPEFAGESSFEVMPEFDANQSEPSDDGEHSA